MMTESQLEQLALSWFQANSWEYASGPDSVPKTKGLVLILNVAFGEIQDPEGRCEDVTDKGRWGNGDIRMMVASKEDIPYAMGLVRQSIEKQLGQPASH